VDLQRQRRVGDDRRVVVLEEMGLEVAAAVGRAGQGRGGARRHDGEQQCEHRGAGYALRIRTHLEAGRHRVVIEALLK
jgi:hypothetical protein